MIGSGKNAHRANKTFIVTIDSLWIQDDTSSKYSC
jgi:hypothetical protein